MASVFIDAEQRDSHIPGDNVTFYCPPGPVLTGPNSSTCMRNGEWEPDPWTKQHKMNFPHI